MSDKFKAVEICKSGNHVHEQTIKFYKCKSAVSCTRSLTIRTDAFHRN
jgi:hypothetical protein